MDRLTPAKLWVSHLICSIILIASIYAKTNIEDDDERELDQAFGEVIPMLSIFLSIIMIASHCHPSLRSIIGTTQIEGTITILTLVFSIILVAIVTGSGHGLAIDEDGSIAYGNQYYFSWIALGNSMVLSDQFVLKAWGVRISTSPLWTSTARSLKFWVGILFTSIVVMGSASEYYGRSCHGDDYQETLCGRCTFGIASGIIGGMFAGGILIMKVVRGVTFPFLVELWIAAALLIVYGLEVALVTDNQGPGAPLGNLYYFSWASFLLVIAILNACHEDYVRVVDGGQREQVTTVEVPAMAHGDGADGYNEGGEDDIDGCTRVDEELNYNEGQGALKNTR